MHHDTRSAAGLPLLTAEQMRQWDREAIVTRGIPERVLMESAGRAAASIVHERYPEGRVAGVVGGGNNGGDTLVLLRTLKAWGRDVFALPVPGVEVSRELLHGWEIEIREGPGTERSLREAGVVVDGILGTGASGPPREPQAGLIRAVAASGRPVVALDGPTGVDLTTGAVEGEAVDADITVTFGAPKRGLLLQPGRRYVGEVIVVETGFPPLEPEGVGAAVITEGWARGRWRPLPPDAHKGMAGRLVVLAGSLAMGGAAILCGHAAARSGAGTVRIVSPLTNRTAVQVALPEALFLDRDAEEIEEIAEGASAIVAGPGMGLDDGARKALARMVRHAAGPLLLDADALTLLAGDPQLLPDDARARTVLTPHPGEMGRLLGIDTERATADPFAAVQRARDRFRCVVLLKGAPTLIASPDEPILANVTGRSGLGVGGMGDTLAGVIGAFLARGVPPYDAAGLGIYLAGLAADRFGRGRPILPRDVAEAIPGVIGGMGSGGSG